MSAAGRGGALAPAAIWRPSVTVAAIIERDGKFLLVEEMQDGRRVLNQPAGHLDPEETLIDACAREVLEETAHRFVPSAMVGIYRWHYKPAEVTYLRFCFAGKILGVEQRALDRDIRALHWLTPAELRSKASMHRSPLVQQCLDDFLAGCNFPIEVLSRSYG
jgi:ADP-ribose pyrophosphatase YjhB (NUDIX family)